MSKVKQFFAKKKAVVLCAGSAFALVSTSAFATVTPTLTTAEQGMVDAVVDKFEAMVSAVTSMATANLGVVAAMVVAAMVIGYFWSMGRK